MTPRKTERDEADRVRDSVIKNQSRALWACGIVIAALALRVAFTEGAVIQFMASLFGGH